MKRFLAVLMVLAALAAAALSATPVAATSLTNRITGLDQNGVTTVLYCSGAHCHSVYGYIYGDPTTVTGDLWRVAPAARGYTWRWVGPVSAICQPDTSVVGFELVCGW